jgi:hypothetical protein
VQLERGERRRQPAAALPLDRPDVAGAAVAVVVEGRRRRDAAPAAVGDREVEVGEVGAREEVGRRPEGGQVVGPVRRSELELRPGQADDASPSPATSPLQIVGRRSLAPAGSGSSDVLEGE